MEHSHAHQLGLTTGRVLRWSLAATFVFVVVEIAAGIESHSLALLSDAGHNFTDCLSLLLAWFGLYLQSKPADEIKTYGYHRAGVLCAFVNAATIVLVSVWIFYESILRLSNPEPVREGVMMAVAALGLLVNGGIMWALRARRADLNIKSAFVHMMGDAFGSAAIIAGAVVIRMTGWVKVDPVLSIVIGVLVVWTAWDIIRESLNILLEGLPRGLRLKDVDASLRKVEGVLDVHDLHIWSLGSNTRALSCHALIDDVPPSASEAILRRVNTVLCERFRIDHTTIQFEHVGCAISENGCAISTHADEREGHRHA